jgi:sugar phosphate isomerase/epimerase
MKMDRRTLLVSGAAAGAGLAASSRLSAATSPLKGKGKPQLKISSQEGIIPGKDLPEKLANMEQWGFDGIEIGGGGLAGRVSEIQKALANSKIKLSAICAGFQGVPISHDAAERKKAADTMKEILTAAGELGAVGLIFVPAFNGQTNLSWIDGRKVLLEWAPEVADHAQKCGTTLLMEPLNRGETWYLRQCADAASIVRDANHPGLRMMGDFYHMYIEETNDMGAFLSAGDYLRHVHLASIKRKLPGQDERDYTNGFAGLKMIGYQDFCSFECGVLGEREVEIPKSVKFLRNQWKKA